MICTEKKSKNLDDSTVSVNDRNQATMSPSTYDANCSLTPTTGLKHSPTSAVANHQTKRLVPSFDLDATLNCAGNSASPSSEPVARRIIDTEHGAVNNYLAAALPDADRTIMASETDGVIVAGDLNAKFGYVPSPRMRTSKSLIQQQPNEPQVMQRLLDPISPIVSFIVLIQSISIFLYIIFNWLICFVFISQWNIYRKQ